MLLKAQYYDPESWAANKVVLTAFATFAAAVVGISQLGDLLVPVRRPSLPPSSFSILS